MALRPELFDRQEKFGKKIAACMEATEVADSTLADELKVKVELVDQWKRGRKRIGKKNFGRALETFEKKGLPEAMRTDLAAAFERLQRDAKLRSIPERLLGDLVDVRYLPDPFHPFSGTPELFIDRLVARAIASADLQLERKDAAAIGLERRMEAVENRSVHLMTNLVTQARMRKIQFFETPIHVSLNAVARVSALKVDDLDTVREILGGSLTPKADDPRPPFEVLTVNGEIGSRYVRRLSDSVTWLSNAWRATDDFSPTSLADALRKASTPTVLVCDEVTAMQVRAALGADGVLLYPLTTEMSVQGSRKRRHFPHYPLGIGWRRPRSANQSRLLDEDNAKLFEDILRSVVTLDVHTLAVEYKSLYDDVVQLVARNLAESPELYVGGVRRRAVDTFGEDSWYRESLIDQSARSYASRCLQLSQRAADEYQAHDVWTPMLCRTRQLVLQAESRRRNAIRAALRSAINVTAGLPEDAEKLSRDRFRYALRENPRQLAHLLEREYEFRLPDGLAFFYRWAQAPLDDAEGASFEKFLSAFQGQLEIASGGPHLVVVENVPANELRDPLVDQYDNSIEHGPASQEDLDRLANRRNLDPATLTVIRAQSLGETVGLAWVHQNGHILHLEDLYVVEHMRSSRVSQLLIRRAIELADAIEGDDVNVEIKNKYVPKKPKDRTKWFKEVGFHIDRQNQSTVLTYKIFKLSLDQLPDDANLPKTARDVFIDERRATPKRREGDLQERSSLT